MLSNGLNSFFHWLTFLVKSRNGLQVTNYIQQTLFPTSEFSLKNNSMGKNGQKSRLFCHYDINMYMSLFDLVDVTFAEDCLWKQNFAGNFIGKYIRWVWNSSKKKKNSGWKLNCSWPRNYNWFLLHTVKWHLAYP